MYTNPIFITLVILLVVSLVGTFWSILTDNRAPGRYKNFGADSNDPMDFY